MIYIVFGSLMIAEIYPSENKQGFWTVGYTNFDGTSCREELESLQDCQKFIFQKVPMGSCHLLKFIKQN